MLNVRFHFDPTPIDGAPRGAHPVGGPSKLFIDVANKHKEFSGVEFVVDDQYGSGKHENLYIAVALGAKQGGFDSAVSIAITNGHPFGELLVAGLPFGMSPVEYMAWLYKGGGLKLQQQLYDEAFDKSLVVIPIAITPGQGAGWFPEPSPDPGNDWKGKCLSEFDEPTEDDKAAMRELSQRKMIVRWPEPAGLIWREASKSVGSPATFLEKDQQQGRSADSSKPVGSDGNPETFAPDRLTFGGFSPGSIPQQMLLTGNIDCLYCSTFAACP